MSSCGNWTCPVLHVRGNERVETEVADAVIPSYRPHAHETSMKFTNTFKYHTENPTGSVEQYARSRRIDLARKIRGAKKIYLDTNFWIWFARCSLRAILAVSK